MGKTLILTEKPSVARDFASALKVRPSGQGVFESEQFVITWAIGHLMELKAPEDYNAKWKKWTIESLPILPARMGYKVNGKTKSQHTIVMAQLQRRDLSRLILATDAGREGELIGRTLLDQIEGITFPCFRFWTSQALSANVILNQMKSLKPLKDYDRLHRAGQSRQWADWLVGMNLSRLATIKMGDLFPIGRVQTAVLSLLVQRRKDIEEFKPELFFTILGKFDFEQGQLSAQWFDPTKKGDAHKILLESQVKEILSQCEGHPAVVKNLGKETKSQAPPQLFSLTELQKVANRQFGFSAKKTLNLAQTLYEKDKCLSYPRTDARVLGTESLGQVQDLIKEFKSKESQYFEYLDLNKVSLKNKRVFNDDKLTDHHALIPLKNYYGIASSDEGKLFDLVLKRFVSVFSKNYEYEETKVWTQVNNENFKTKGQRVVCLGWKALSGGEQDQILPALEINERGKVNSLKPEKKWTRPPAEYTEATLLQDMINPSRWVEEENFKKAFRGDIGLGTQATRAQIIEGLITRKYIVRKAKNVMAVKKGILLIKNLKSLKGSQVLTSPSETANWELELEKLAQGEGDPKAFMKSITEFVSQSTEEWKGASFEKVPFSERTKREDSQSGSTTEVGACPNCKSRVVSFPKSYSCERWQEGCKFTIWKQIAGKKISVAQVKKILTKGQSDALKGFKSKAGKEFSAALVLKDQGVSFEFKN